MEVRSIDRTQFGAKLISPAKVKYKAGKYWKDLDVSFIKFETTKVTDRSKLDAVSYIWDGRNLSKSIAEEANILGGKSNIYGLTLQKTDFDNILPDHILGLVSTGKVKNAQDGVEIFKIGTNPKFAYEQKRRSRDIKHIAATLLDSLRALAGGKKSPKLYANYANPEEIKFLNRVGIEPRSTEAVEVIGK